MFCITNENSKSNQADVPTNTFDFDLKYLKHDQSINQSQHLLHCHVHLPPMLTY